MFKNIEQFADIAPFLLNRIYDRHNRFHLVSHFSNITRRLLSKISSKMGDAFFFSFWNPTGHYALNLASLIEREIAMTLIVLNKEVNKLIVAGSSADRSAHGNKSCFRNEKMNGMAFDLESSEWILPQSGLFELDFVYLVDRPSHTHEGLKQHE